MLKFSNPGEIDPRLITTLGVNVKEDNLSANGPIGYFGTGLKYAIAGVLRTGGSIEVHSGTTRLHFGVLQEEIRGKTFSFIQHRRGAKPRMNDATLGFTTDLGKNWEPWMWYRELASNTLDEGGAIEEVTEVGLPTPCETNIYVEGLDEEHAKRAGVFISGKPLVAGNEVDIFPGDPSGPNFIYYRNVRVGLPNLPSAFRYNLKIETELTEDRTLASSWEAFYHIDRAWCRVKDVELLEQALLAKEDTFEGKRDFDQQYIENPVLDDTIERLMQTALGRVNPSAVQRMKKKRGATKPSPALMSRHETEMLHEAKVFLAENLNVHITVPLHITESLGERVHGLAWGKEIFLGRLAFEEGTDHLIIVLLEEWLHAERGLGDYSREIQTWLLNKIVSTARRRSEASEESTTTIPQKEPLDDIPF